MQAILAAGGDPPHEMWRERLRDADLVIAADSGLTHLHALGLRADIVVNTVAMTPEEAADHIIAKLLPLK